MESTSQALQRRSETISMIELIDTARREPKACDEPIERIKETNRWVFAMLDIDPKHIEDEAAKLVLIDYILTNVRNYSLLDIKNAITLYIQNKLDFSESNYRKFTPVFLENVLQSYRRYVVNLPKKPVEKLPELPEPTPEEHEKNMIEGCLKLWEQYKATGEANDYGNIYYNWMDRNGLIHLSNIEKWNLYTSARHELKKEAITNTQAYKGNDGVKSIIAEIENNAGNIVVNRAKKLALKYEFQKMVDENVELKYVIELCLK